MDSQTEETHRSVFFRIPFRPRSGRRAFATIFSDSGEKVTQLAGLIFSNIFFDIYFFLKLLKFPKIRETSSVATEEISSSVAAEEISSVVTE